MVFAKWVKEAISIHYHFNSFIEHFLYNTDVNCLFFIIALENHKLIIYMLDFDCAAKYIIVSKHARLKHCSGPMGL